MDAIKEVFEFLNRHTGFNSDLQDLVQNPQWPTCWLTSHQFIEEVDRFQFWTGLRSRVPTNTRRQLLELYLKYTANDDSSGWVQIDDQFKYNPDQADIDNGKAIDNENPQRRRHGRVSCEMLSCQLGEVVNLSASGVKILSKGTPQHSAGDRFDLDMKCLDHQVHATVRVVWTKQVDSTYKMGMEFVDLTAEQAQQIRELLPLAAAVQPAGHGTDGECVAPHWGK